MTMAVPSTRATYGRVSRARRGSLDSNFIGISFLFAQGGERRVPGPGPSGAGIGIARFCALRPGAGAPRARKRN